MISPPPTTSKSCQDGLKFGQDALQDLPKTILERFFLHLLFRLRFCSVWAPTWAPFVPRPGGQDDFKINSKNVRKSYCRKISSKIAPRRPQIPHRVPQDLPKGAPDPQRSPRTPPDPTEGPAPDAPQIVVLSLEPGSCSGPRTDLERCCRPKNDRAGRKNGQERPNRGPREAPELPTSFQDPARGPSRASAPEL